MGRPTKYKEEYCEMLIEDLGNGMTYTAFAGLIGVNIDTLYEWEKVHSAFSDAKKIGRAKQERYLLEVGNRAMMGKIKGFNATPWVFMMKNMCGWKDKAGNNS